jgi:ubiquinone/menaquinone biosynthesis C-methylase UbiE
MSKSKGELRRQQIIGWIVLGVFAAGFFVPGIGAWTGPIMAVWFAGTQKPLRGYVWLSGFALISGLIQFVRAVPAAGFGPILLALAWTIAAAALSTLPFVYYRVASPRLRGLPQTLPFALAAVCVQQIGFWAFPAKVYRFYYYAPETAGRTPLVYLAALLGIGVIPFFHGWVAATVVWLWNEESRARKSAWAGAVVCGVLALAVGVGAWREFAGALLPQTLPQGRPFACICLFAILILSAFMKKRDRRTWAERAEAAGTMGILRSPETGLPIKAVAEWKHEFLTSVAGERFPVRDGIPNLLRPEDLTGQNRKYNHLYETIGGFYDDSQRVFIALGGIDRADYVMSYMGRIEVKPGDRVLETSVGTGLNFKYLPRDITRFGLDLSSSMLAACQQNLLRWDMDAELFLGNAERLPFADESFDVVFHVGGINFFSDRARAIREMIRVARPGAPILIADETEEHVKAAYENIPYTREFYKDREEAVAAPVDLIPPEMEGVHLEIINVVGKNRFYALTFRKPAKIGARKPALVAS